MAWNQPGSGGKDPWGQKGSNNQGPPDLDEIVRNIQRKLSGLFGGGRGGGGGLGGGKAGGWGVGLIIVVILTVWLFSGFYVVQQGERGVVLLFGKQNEITDAGLRWHIPYPIESAETVDVQKIHKIEIGYRSDQNGGKRKEPKEALMLTEDENIIDIEFAVQYRISQPADYLFNVRNPEGTIVQATESAVREIAGKNTMDFVLTEGRDEVGQRTQALLQEILDEYKTGIHVVKVDMQEAQPPDEVRSAFDDAVKAREDEERYKNEAEAYANDVIPRARGQAARMIEEAAGYKASKIARAEGDARRFDQIAAEYAKAPRVTRERLYLEAMEKVFSNTTKIYVDQKSGNNLLYLPLDQLIKEGRKRAEEPSSDALQPTPRVSSKDMQSGDNIGRQRPDFRSRGVQ